MADRAYIDDPEELVEFKVTTGGLQLPAAASSIDPLYSSAAKALAGPSNQVLVTSQGEGVQIYSATDSKCLRSWPFPPGVRFACPSKYLFRRTEEGSDNSLVYVVVDSEEDNSASTVWRWIDRGIDSVGLEDKLEANFSSSIFALEPGVTSANHLLILHKDGSLTLATQDLEKRHHISCPVQGKPETIWYQVIEVSQSMRSYLDSRQIADWLEGDFRLVLVLSRIVDAEVEAAHTYYFTLFAIDGSESSVTEVGTTHINPAHLQTQPMACSFVADTGTVAMLSEAGVYVNFSLVTGVSALDDPIMLERTKQVTLHGFVSCANDQTLGSVLESNLIMQSRVAMAALTEKYVAIVGTHSTVSHASKGPYESVLTIWDLQFGCLHAEKTLQLAPSWLQGASKKQQLPRLTYQIQPLNPRLNDSGVASEQMALAITVAHTTDVHASLDPAAKVTRAQKGSNRTKGRVSWDVKMFVASAFLPPVTLLASLRLQNNAKYYVDPEKQLEHSRNVHSSNILLHEEQEQGLGVLRSGWEAVVDGTAAEISASVGVDTVEAFVNISKKREDTQNEENEVLLALANVSDTINGDQYTQLFMDHIGVKLTPDTAVESYGATWISAHLMTTVMRRCFAEPLGMSRSSQLPLYAPKVVEFMLINCGLCNSHAPSPGLLQHLLARVDRKGCKVLASDQAWNLVNIALRRCPDLPEQQVVEVLKFQLSHYADYVDQLFDLALIEAEDRMQVQDTTNLIAADVMRTVSAVSSVAGSEDMLRLALASLPLNHAACVLRLLINWMRAWTQVGANVELAASEKFVQPTTASLAHRLGSAGSKDNMVLISETIAQANPPSAPVSHDTTPAVDATLTAFKVPQVPPADTENGASIVRVFTRKWAPTLVLPENLVGAPELKQIVQLATLVLDAHLSNILLSSEFSTLIAQLTEASDQALAISEQLRLLRIGLVPFHMAWQKQQDKRVADDLAEQKQALGLDEVVLLNGMTRSQAERKSEAQPNAKCSQGAGPSGTYWERIQKLEKYRVEVMHW
ncbi:hypothetical protein LPJ78_002913 [Coemansia sp. RSA 989]|nr:hypothetical protein LPJ68_002663 [Coemansia sp. RSA 1086]KAJ1750412.1 hypothetical protein LPJ79_002921 [Coemansia sp. RSA 1821]KAJ1865113.1 hypothetical protein LPJ78_002913 [Coemansia sp. RSA 989]KAJ2675428.1 hypothetical protein IWW42_001214 [Coemansia sp. RSA 1085]